MCSFKKNKKMKKTIILSLLLFIGAKTFLIAQDPLASFTVQRDLTKIEASLSTEGRALLASEKKEYDQLRIKSYQFSPNRCMNYPLTSLESLMKEDISPSFLQRNTESNLAKLPTIKRAFEAKGIKWNPLWLIDLMTIDWTKYLIGAAGCTLNTSILQLCPTDCYL
jgi:hypothetical protein